ncbi:MAG: 3'-5' exonuclease [Candidatus Azobacteroides sp.]|nr:3'-5' exonuclease [Candidatus Azobacteroides sp.]
MLEYIPIQKILFLDIETVPACASYDDLSDMFKLLWDKKAGQLQRMKDENLSSKEMYAQAGIYAEFGKIICISVGYFARERELRIKSFYGEDEKEILSDFSLLLNKHFNTGENLLCAHNGKEFDFPYIARRLLINGMEIPRILNTAGKKPWEINHLDTMELWKFGDYKSYASLNLLAAVFNIPTPKDDIDGSQVGEVYWKDGNLERIVQYCQKDVLTIARLFLKYRCEPILKEENIVFT